MQLPFSVEQFFAVFRVYNETVWPAQSFLLALALLAIVLVVFPRRRSGVGVSAILAFLWGWLGLAYHWAFFTAINPLAYVFSAASVAGAVVFLWQGMVRQKLQFRLARNARTAAGLLLLFYALAIYPAWAVYSGHRYPAMPTFGLPCPTTLFTMGMLAFLVAPYPRSALFIPVLWCVVGAQGAFLLAVPEDLGLIVAGAFGIMLMIRSSVSSPRITAQGSRR
jgi:hypothetical protein